jgi:IS1 family transposase
MFSYAMLTDKQINKQAHKQSTYTVDENNSFCGSKNVMS